MKIQIPGFGYRRLHDIINRTNSSHLVTITTLEHGTLEVCEVNEKSLSMLTMKGVVDQLEELSDHLTEVMYLLTSFPPINIVGNQGYFDAWYEDEEDDET